MSENTDDFARASQVLCGQYLSNAKEQHGTSKNRQQWQLTQSQAVFQI